MSEYKDYNNPLNDDLLGGISAGTRRGGHCPISQDQFPADGICCSKIRCMAGNEYVKICPFCSIWSSLPDSTNLEVTYIVECSSLGYGLRIKV